MKQVGDAEKDSIKKALAKTLGVDVADVAITKVTFPVKSTLSLGGVTVDSVDKAALSKSLAKDLSVKESDVTVTSLTSARRHFHRSVLQASPSATPSPSSSVGGGGVDVEFKVANVESTATATALAAKLNTVATSASSNLVKTAKAGFAHSFVYSLELKASGLTDL